jgi:Ni,Fe-hydrogenase III large subunit
MGAPGAARQAMPVPGSPSAARIAVDAAAWIRAARDLAGAGGCLLSLWATRPSSTMSAMVRAAVLIDGRALVLELALPEPAQAYPGLQEIFPAAGRMQRAAFDLCGIRSDDSDQRPWLQHADEGYAFVRVEGEGVHEIPVGPVHAGIIEPGHFRFSTVGEKVLRLEERLGYVHKGIEWRFEQMNLLDGHRLAARVSGDSAVAYSWAYCQALEGLAGVTIPPRALWLRALCLELERLQNHLGDLGALGNDAGFAFGLSQFSRLKEELTRAIEAALGRRYLMDTVAPGGMACDLRDSAEGPLANCIAQVARAAQVLRRIYDDHGGVRDRFAGAGCVDRALARRLGLIGLAGRASGQAFDLRADGAWEPYDRLEPVKIVREEGDVAARVAVRFDELQESCRLIAQILRTLPPGPWLDPVGVPYGQALGIGLIEGWRGPVMIALESGPNGTIRRCHPQDPSWQNWPVLEHAIIGNIVPDFPLINKSFNLSYSGHDL